MMALARLPIISAAHNIQATLIREIDVVNGKPQVTDDPVMPPFYVGLTQPDAAAASGESPRQAPPAMLRHASGLTGPRRVLRAGSRLSLLSRGTYELLDNGVDVTTGTRIVGREYACLPSDSLYPLDGIISDMDGNPIGNMELAIWGATESHDVTAGEFEDYDGEAPIEFAEQLMRNVDIMVGTTRYRVIAAEPEIAFVRLRLRKADEPLAP
jgi:hypothetical protein